jgi:hypothetical protein
MRQRQQLVFIFLMLGFFLSISDQGRSQVTNPDEEGRKLFVVYCASCHGEDGRGKGVVAEAMKVPPSDLTQINKRRDGKFPYDEVRDIISGLIWKGSTVPAPCQCGAGCLRKWKSPSTAA